jgi:hypothetical protein
MAFGGEGLGPAGRARDGGRRTAARVGAMAARMRCAASSSLLRILRHGC